MINKEVYASIISKITHIACNYSNEDFNSTADNLSSVWKNFDMKVMFVGHFNAGKSALINCLIDRSSFLKEEQIPETAIAAEIRYSEKECYLAYDDSGKVHELKENGQSDAARYHHFVYMLNCESLREISDFTVVDTPGFDSGIENHNRALMNYIIYGSAYIFVIDAEKGGIDKYALDFFKEISIYSRQISVIINKCDKQTPSNVEAIKKSAECTLAMYGYDCNVYCLSKLNEDISGKLVKIIAGFDAQKAFDSHLGRQIFSSASVMREILSMTNDKLSSDTYDLNLEIHKLTQAKEMVRDSFLAKRRQAENDYSNLTEQIISEVKSALISRADAAADAMLSGGAQAVQAVAMETVRPIIVSSLKQATAMQLDDLSGSIDFSSLMDIKASKSMEEIVLNIASGVKQLIDDGTFSKAFYFLEEKEEPDKKIKSNKSKSPNDDHTIGMYRTVTASLSIITDVIAPWLEILIVFLPDIIAFVKNLFGESDHSKARKLFENAIVPQITSGLHPHICQAVSESYAALMDSMEQSISEKLNSLDDALCEAEQKKSDTLNDFEEHKKRIAADIETLSDIIEETRRYYYGA